MFLLADRDYFFKLIYNIPVILFIYVVDSGFSTIFIENKSDIIIILPKRLRLNKIIDYKQKGYYMAKPDAAELIKKNHI